MMKPLLIASLLALAAPQADAGDFKFGFGYRNGKVKIGVGYRDDHRGPRHRRHVKRGHRVWVPGHYDIVKRKVWVPGHRKRVWHEVEYGYRYDACGRRVKYIVSPGHWDYIETPGRYVIRRVRVYHPGHWEYHRHHH